MKLFSNTGAFIQTVGPRNAIDDTISLSLVIQRIFGQQVLDPNWTWTRYILHQIAMLSLIIYVAFGTKDILSNSDDIKIIAEASYTIVLSGLCIVKYLLFISARMLLRETYVTVKTSILETINEDSPQKMANVLTTGKKVIYFMYSMISVPVSAYILRVLWFYVKGERVTLSKTTSTLLPMTSPYYEIATILHAIFMAELACTFVMIDTYFTFFLYLYCHASDSVVKSLVMKREEGENDEDYSRRLNESLRKFYLGHLKLVEYLSILNETFKCQCLIPLVTVIICLAIPMLSMSKELDIAFVTNMIPVVSEIFLFNWFGEQIKTKAMNQRDALLNFDWVNLQLRDKKSYYIIVNYMNKNIAVTTVLGGELSLITLTSVLKSSYQAFTMLQSFDN